MQFSKIAYTPPKDGRLGTVRLEWQTTKVTASGDLALDERTFKSQDDPHPDFIEALASLAPAVMAACFSTSEECDEVEEAGLSVRSVTLKETAGEDGDPVDGVTITALRSLDWIGAPLVLNTPFAPVDFFPHPALVDKISTLTREAERFVGGRRAQGDLFAAENDSGEG